jgi:hypothetical protein
MSSIDNMMHDVRVFLLKRGLSITRYLLRFFIKIETNPIFGTQNWNPDVELTESVRAEYLYANDNLSN